MILDELVLQNVGVFAGRNSLTLTPPGPGKPVVLVGGLNGAGKTTILEAIHLALYGSLADTSARRTGSYESYLRSLIHQAVTPGEGAAVELAFHAFHEGVPHSYRVRRSWRQIGTSVKESLAVLRDGEPDGTLAETWAEHIESFLPRGIAGLFFFDGEQIESLADLDRSRQVLGSALASLLGLELVDRLTADLAVLRRRHRSSQLPEDLQRRVQDAQNAFSAARQAESTAIDVAANARTEQARTALRHDEAAERYRAHGGDLLAQRHNAETRLAEFRKERENIDDELREIAEGAAPLLLVRSALHDLAVQAGREAEAIRTQVALEVLGTRDDEIIVHLRESGTHARAISSVEKFLTRDREHRRLAADIERIAGLDDPLAVESLTSHALPNGEQLVRRLLTRRAETDAQLEAAERFLAAIPHPEAVAHLREAFDAARDRATVAAAACASAEERLQTLTEQRVRAAANYERAMDDTAHATLSVDDDRRLVDHADRVRATLEALKTAATQRHLERICSLVLDSLRNLMRKENLITEITIDPATYAVELRGSAGQPLAAEQLSVGERQLLAVALLWGLARASGQPLPVVIDTPLGRLDSAHRSHLLDRYFPYASHQVVLLSTDTEIAPDAWKAIAIHVGRSYRLEFDPSAGASTVRTGYFWEQ
jgi:DNA sulfur modification protein DndD